MKLIDFLSLAPNDINNILESKGVENITHIPNDIEEFCVKFGFEYDPNISISYLKFPTEKQIFVDIPFIHDKIKYNIYYFIKFNHTGRIKQVHITDVVLFNENSNIFGNESTNGNLVYKLGVNNNVGLTKSISDHIKQIRKEIKKLRPYFNKVSKSYKTGDYIHIYNLYSKTDFIYGKDNLSAPTFQECVDILYDVTKRNYANLDAYHFPFILKQFTNYPIRLLKKTNGEKEFDELANSAVEYCLKNKSGNYITQLNEKVSFKSDINNLLGIDKAWNLKDILSKLVEAADILLDKKDYDGHGWEDISHVRKYAREKMDLLDKIIEKYFVK